MAGDGGVLGGYETEVRFVCVDSQGGPFDERAFTAGWTCAVISRDLIDRDTQSYYLVYPELLPQLDLLAMRHGHHLVVLRGERPGFVPVTFRRDPN